MNIAQRAFAGGELAPSLYARTDTSKYQQALRKCRNFFIQRHGGIQNRPGTEFIVEVKDSTKTVRLVPFIFNADQTYVLEFGNGYIRFSKDGAQLTSGGFPYEITSPYLEADLMELQFVQSADVITIVHQNYAPRDLSRTADTAWTLSVITFGASIGSVSNLAMGGGSAGGPTYYAVTAIDGVTGEEGLPTFVNGALEPSTGTPITLTWDDLAGAASYRVYRSTDNGTTYELLADSGGTPTQVFDDSWVDDAELVNTTTTDTWVPAAGQARNDVIAAGVPSAPYDQRFVIKGNCTVQYDAIGGGFGAASGRLSVYYKRNTDGARVLAGTFPVSGAVSVDGTGAATSEPFSVTITVPDNGYTDLQIDVVPEVYGSNAVALDEFNCDVDFATLVGTYDRIVWNTISSGFSDDGSDGDPLQSPPHDRHLFESSNDYPAAVGIYQQRKMYANTINEPETVWASRTGAYKNFFVSSPLEDDDAVTWSHAGRQVNRVKHLLDLQRLIVFTSGSEMTVEGDEAGILRPDAINPRKFSRNGIEDLRPLEINDSAVYVQARGTIVRDLKPQATSQSYDSTDLTIFAAHLFNGYTLEDWDYALAPHSIVWAVRSDGTLLGLTYLPEQAIFGWHRHDTDGVIERVCVVPEDDEDRVYLVVKRTIDGSDVRYIERLASRFFTDVEDAVFVDSSLSYDGAPATVFSGLDHLEGEDVSVVADGEVIANPNDSTLPVITVASGAITLTDAASVVHVGLPYLSDIETLDIDTPQGRSAKETKMNINRVNLFVEETQGLWAGQSEPAAVTDGLQRFEYDDDSLVTDAIKVNIESTWNSNGRIFVRQVDPKPVTILAAIPQGFL